MKKLKKQTSEQNKFLESLVKKLANLFLFVYKRDQDAKLPQFTYLVLLVIFFAQIQSFLTSSIILNQGSKNNVATEVYLNIVDYLRINPLLRLFESSIVAPIVSLFFLFIDLFMISICVVLSKSSTIPWVLAIFRVDFQISAIMCSVGEIKPNLCQQTLDFSLFPSALWITISSLTIITQLILQVISLLIYSNSEFTCPNLIKQRYSKNQIIKLILFNILSVTSYLDESMFLHITSHLIFIYFIFEYTLGFPLLNTKITINYCFILVSTEISFILYTLWEYTTIINDTNFLMVFMVTVSLAYGIINVKIQTISKKLMYFVIEQNFNKPNEICQYLEQLHEKYMSYKHNQVDYMELMAILSIHQEFCTITECPCQDPNYSDREKVEREIRAQEENMNEAEKVEKKVLIVEQIDLKGNYIYDISQNDKLFSKFINDFIDFQMNKLAKSLQKTPNYQMQQDIAMRYWFFLTKYKGNYIKSLIESKIGAFELTNKSIFFLMIDSVLTTLIENKIKENDKAFLYSYKLKDSENVQMYIRFENFVNSETSIREVILDIIKLTQQKINWYEKQILGYEHLHHFYIETHTLVEEINKIEKKLNKLIKENPGNIYFLKFHSLLKSRLYNDPSQSNIKEQEIIHLKRKDQSLDKNTVNSLTILQGDVGSIIASFRHEKGKILNYSKTVPALFEYDKNSFSNVQSVKDLVPDFISNVHDLFIERLVVQGYPKIMRTYRRALGKLKSGYLQDMKLYVNYYFQISSEFSFSALILKTQSPTRIAFVNETGDIVGCNQLFGDFICPGLNSQYFLKLNINLICMDFYEYMQAFNEDSDNTFVKFKLQFPQNQDCEQYFINFIKVYQSIDQTAPNLQQLQQKAIQDFLKNEKEDFEREHCKFNYYEIICNVQLDQIVLITGQVVNLYILEFEQFFQLRDGQTTTASNTSTIDQKDDNSSIKSPLKSNQNNQFQEGAINSKINQEDQTNQDLNKSLNQDIQKENQKLTQSKEEDVLLTNRQEETNRNDLLNKPEYNMASAIEDTNHLLENNIDLKIEKTELQQLKDQIKSGTNPNDTSQTNLTNQTNENDQDNDEDHNLEELNSELVKATMGNQQKQGDNSIKHQKSLKTCKSVVSFKQQISQKKVKSYTSFFEDEQEQNNNNLEAKKNQFNPKYIFDIGFGEKQMIEEGGSQKGHIDNSIVKQVSTLASSNTLPQELKSLYFSYIFQIIIVFLILLGIEFIVEYEAKGLLRVMEEAAHINHTLSPISRLLLVTTTLGLQNEGSVQQYSPQFQDFLINECESLYEEYPGHVAEVLQLPASFSFQDEMLNKIMEDTIVQREDTELKIDISVLEYMKILFDIFFQVSKPELIDTITYKDDQSKIVYKNIGNVFISIMEQKDQMEADLKSQKDEMGQFYILSFIVSAVVVMFCYCMMLPGFSKLKQRMERICLCISRVTESEAQVEIYIQELIQQKLQSESEDYLHSYFHNYNIPKQTFKLILKQKNKNNTKEKKSQGNLSDRIANQKLNFTIIFIVMAFLIIISQALFVVIFVYQSSYATDMQPISEDYANIIEKSQQFAFVAAEHRLTYLNRFYLDKGEDFIDQNYLQQLQSQSKQFFTESSQYLSKDYYNIGRNDNYEKDFSEFMQKLNTDRVCQNEEFVFPNYTQICLDTAESMINRGFSLYIKNQYNIIENQQFQDWDIFEIKEYLFGTDQNQFVEDTILLIMSQKLFTVILERFSIANYSLEDNFIQLIQLLFIVGGLSYLLLFSILFLYFLRKLQQEYILIKKAIQLIPYKRIQEDQTTHHLLKRIFKF